MDDTRDLESLRIAELETIEDLPHLPPWLISLALHLILLIGIAFVSTEGFQKQSVLVLASVTDTLDTDLETEQPEEFEITTDELKEVGSLSEDGIDDAKSMAPEIDDPTDVPAPELMEFDVGQIDFRPSVDPAGLHESPDRIVKGATGFGTTGANGAVDFITKEIQESLDVRKTLVVWLFDQSASMIRQRKTIEDRLNRVYRELGILNDAGEAIFSESADPPLLSSVVAFGENVLFPVKQPTQDIDAIKQAIQKIPRDDSGEERVFTALQKCATRFKKYRREGKSELTRNVIFVVFSDEAGDDQQLLDETVNVFRNLAIRVYTIGVPAPFGRSQTLVKWVDPDPKYDQTPAWREVTQGPETLSPERIRLHFSGEDNRVAKIDSGFGPYALTRLCYETGGVYFCVHPNRQTKGRIRRRKIQPFTSHLEVFFNPDVMRRYRPDYISAAEYQRQVNANEMRRSLIAAAQESWVNPMDRPQTRFIKRTDPDFVRQLTESQKNAAFLEPIYERLYEILKSGEKDRDNELVPRWQAGYDLAYGRLLAAKARAESYNLMLAKAKRGMKFDDEKNNTWTLQPADESDGISSSVTDSSEKATEILRRVVDEHQGTPWAHVAKHELQKPFLWDWHESYTDLDPPRARNRNNNNNGPRQRRDDEARKLAPKPKRRAVPRL